MIRCPPRSTPLYSSAASDVYKRQALMDAVDAHPARSSVGPWRLAHADGVAYWPGLAETHAQGLVACALAQVVQVRDRQAGQSFIAVVAILLVGCLLYTSP